MSKRAIKKWRERRKQQVSVADVLPQIFQDTGLASEITSHRIFLDWRALVGERIHSRTNPVSLDNGLLTVGVSNSSWMHELTMMKDDLIEGINERFGETVVREIRLLLQARKSRR